VRCAFDGFCTLLAAVLSRGLANLVFGVRLWDPAIFAIGVANARSAPYDFAGKIPLSPRRSNRRVRCQQMAHSRLDSATGEDVPAPLVRAELERILATELFARSSRLSSFLKFIVEKTLVGEGESLKEHVIAVELYGKTADFNTAEDPIVRVDARRLRDRLREYYAGASDRGVVISVPKGSYTPAFLVTEVRASAPTDSRGQRRWIVGAVALVLVLAAVQWLADRRNGDTSEPRLLTVTSLPGNEEDPSLSPDGHFVVFSWSGPPPSTKGDIWIKSVDGEAMRRLTNTPDVDEHWPRWSPDGQWIAFSRARQDGPVVVKVSTLGGPEETIAENAFDATWTPDGRGLVMTWRGADHQPTLMHQVLDTGVRRPIVRTPPGFIDRHPRISPDGRTLAFVRAGAGGSAVFMVPMAGGEPALFGEWSGGGGPIGGIEWMPDGRQLLAARPTASFRRIMRSPIGARGPDVPLAGTPDDAAGLSVVRMGGSRYRLVVASGQPDIGVRLVDLQSPGRVSTIKQDTAFCDSTRVDMPGRFSPDGSRVAFGSNRSRGWQLWVANRDGSGLHPLTQFQDAAGIGASWSPDGRSLVIGVTIGDRADLSIVPVDGGPSRSLSAAVGAIDPVWSRDGRWIYFASTRLSRTGIWKIGTDGSGLTRLTSDVGFDPHESPDGRSVYFIDRPGEGGLGGRTTLKRVAVDSGPVEIVDLMVMPGAWDVTDTGIVFVADIVEATIDLSRGANTLQAYDFTDGRIRTIGQLPFVVPTFGIRRLLTVSRDGRWALVSHVDRWERDILVLDGFR